MFSFLKKHWISVLAAILFIACPVYAAEQEADYSPNQVIYLPIENAEETVSTSSAPETVLAETSYPAGSGSMEICAAGNAYASGEDEAYRVVGDAGLKSQLTTMEKKIYEILASEDLTRAAYNSGEISEISTTVGNLTGNAKWEYVIPINLGTMGVFTFDHAPESDEVAMYAYQIMDAAVRAMDALSYDDPLLYWIGSTLVGITYSYQTSGSGDNITYTFTYTGYVFFSQRYDDAVKDMAAVKTALSEAILAIDGSLSAGDGDAQTFRLIHEYVMTLAEYGNTDKNVSHSLSSILLDKYSHKGVCQAYARLIQALCSAFDIPCMAVPGSSSSAELKMTHIWNYVQLDGKWYFVDATWDDSGSSNDYYLLWKNDVIGTDSHIPMGYYSTNPDNGLPIYREFTFPELAEFSFKKETYHVTEKKTVTAALEDSPRMDTQPFTVKWTCETTALTMEKRDYSVKLSGVSAEEDLLLTAATTIGKITFTATCRVDVDHDFGVAEKTQPDADTVQYRCICSACGTEQIKTLSGRPKLKSLTMGTTGNLTLKWGSISGVLTYAVYRKTSESGNWKKLCVVSNTQYTDKTAKAGNVYYYTVCGVLDGFTGLKNETGICIRYLAAPVISSMTNVSTGIQIKWNKVAGASGYRVCRLVDGTWKKVADVSGTTYTFKNAVNNTYYRFAIRCMDGDGRVISVRSESVRQDYYKAPTGLKAANYVAGIKLSWTAVKGVNSYKIYRRVEDSSSWKMIATVNGNTYTDTSAKKGTTYIYRLRCVDPEGEAVSAYSGTVSRIRLAAVKPKANVSTGKVKLSWDKVTGAEGYKIYRKTGSGSYTLIATIKKGSTLTYIDQTVKAGKTYYYRVRAYSGSTIASYISSKVKAK